MHAAARRGFSLIELLVAVAVIGMLVTGVFFENSRVGLRDIVAHSNHPDGVNALFCDGHVQFSVQTVNLSVWQALGSRNGHEMIGEF